MEMHLALPTREEFRLLRRRWRVAKSLLRHAINTVDRLYRMEGASNDFKANLMYQRGQLCIVMDCMDSKIPTIDSPLIREQAKIHEVEETVDANVDCLNLAIEAFHRPLPLIGDGNPLNLP
jgi:hypothetical protein